MPTLLSELPIIWLWVFTDCEGTDARADSLFSLSVSKVFLTQLPLMCGRLALHLWKLLKINSLSWKMGETARLRRCWLSFWLSSSESPSQSCRMSLASNGAIISNTFLPAGRYTSELSSYNPSCWLYGSLEKDTARRASPWRMLEHPWIVEMRNKKVNMYNFLAQVWEWQWFRIPARTGWSHALYTRVPAMYTMRFNRKPVDGGYSWVQDPALF